MSVVSSSETVARKGGLSFAPHFSNGFNPMGTVEWQPRDIRVKDHGTGEVIFKQDGFRVPSFWSENAGTIAASKYAFGPDDAREGGVDVIINRVCNAIADWAVQHGKFATGTDALNFRRELKYLCVHQYAAFNSPVWFNVGIHGTRGLKGTGKVWAWDHVHGAPFETTKSYVYPQTSACFIQSVEDNMESLMDLAVSEGMLFKHGSGTGTDFTPIRSKRERLSTGGTPSGPLSFMKIYDRIASTVKSGGKTRRAAKMQTMLCSHPDIMDFITAKGREEKKAKMLIAAGMDPSFNGEAYDTVAFQNANFTVRYTDQFMFRLDQGGLWALEAVTDGRVIEMVDPGVIWDAMSRETWLCGDPGAQFSDTINRWHTCKNTGPINSSNPCSEYLFIDDSACNLASIRLTKFWDDGKFDVKGFQHATRVIIAAQEFLVDMGSYPTRKIAQNQHDYRTLGIGFADLGALVMKMGKAYDSDAGRAIAGSISALLTGTAYAASAEMAEAYGAFAGYEANRAPMLAVIYKHLSESRALMADLDRDSGGRRYDESIVNIASAAEQAWTDAYRLGCYWGFRNAQASVLAPTGTISFYMDCDTTGIEPGFSLVTYKTLAGGGNLTIYNNSIMDALETLAYDAEDSREIYRYIGENGHVVGCERLNDEDIEVFDTAAAPTGCDRTISYMGHLKMMAACQPFISGAISKTVNVPKEFTAYDIGETYKLAYKLGLKCVAIYRDGSKGSQPISADKPTDTIVVEAGEGIDEFEYAVDATRSAPVEGESCWQCGEPSLAVAGTCSVCPTCGEPQGGCS